MRRAKSWVVVFTCDHCPIAQFYETRIKQLAEDYRDRGVALVAIQPNDPEAILLSELGHTDVSDSLAEMKIRSQYRHFNFPYLYDGETQRVARTYGPIATPHVFVFDAERRLRYQGRVDNNPRAELVRSQDARDAIEALLEDKPVRLAKTPAVGCSTKWAFKREDKARELERIEHEPVAVKLANADDLKALRKNSSGKLLLVDFWATWCGPCLEEMPALETMYRMYRRRPFELVTVSINYPDEKAGVLSELESQHASSTNLLFGSTDLYAHMGAFDKEWGGAVPYTLLIRPDGEVVYKQSGTSFDPVELRRQILANLPDDGYVGNSAYWRMH